MTLTPIRNKYRQFIDLSGFWKFRPDKDDTGESKRWYNGLRSDIDIAVPGSWNEQLEELGLLFYVGSAWYETESFIPQEFEGKRIWLRIGSADYHSIVWVNGQKVGEDHFGFLPSHYDITDAVTPGTRARIVIKINNELDDTTIPQGISAGHFADENRLREETFPATRFDFFPMGGLHRPVTMFTTPAQHISGIKVLSKVLTKRKAETTVSVEAVGASRLEVVATMRSKKVAANTMRRVEGTSCILTLEIDQCSLWSPDDPFLYSLDIQLVDNGRTIDEYSLRVGVREVTVSKEKLLLNGKEIFLKGFGKHEDFWTSGKGLFPPLVVKDFNLLKWINANSFRTSHYPYADEIMEYADRKGILVIDEVPAVSLDLRYANHKTRKNHKEYIRRLFERDFNHPSVIMWAIGNEPNLVGAESYFKGSGKKYWKEMFEYARSLDRSRPITVPNCQRAGTADPVFEYSDILTINRYYGWYENPGQIADAMMLMEKEMDELHRRYKKPVFVTEFGADTIVGLHSTSDQMFTEEYQSKLLEAYITLIESKPYTVGEHVWNFADFRTPQHFRRVVMNMKGVFTRNREPKVSAFTLKQLWKK